MKINEGYVRKNESLVYEEGDFLQKLSFEKLKDIVKKEGTLFGEALDNRDKDESLLEIKKLLELSKKVITERKKEKSEKSPNKLTSFLDRINAKGSVNAIQDLKTALNSAHRASLIEILHWIQPSLENPDRHHDPNYLEEEMPFYTSHQIKEIENEIKKSLQIDSEIESEKKDTPEK